MKNTWFSISLGDAMLADDSLQQIKKQFITHYEQASCPEQVALLMRHESEGRLHCEVKLYFSPAAEAIARKIEATTCPTPSSHGLSLIAGSDKDLLTLASPRELGPHPLEMDINQDDVAAWRKERS